MRLVGSLVVVFVVGWRVIAFLGVSFLCGLYNIDFLIWGGLLMVCLGLVSVLCICFQVGFRFGGGFG